jgi:hypothetical protein
MVNGHVVERQCDGRRLTYYSHFGLVAKTRLKWRPGGATRRKGRQLVGKVGEWVCGKLAPSKL